MLIDTHAHLNFKPFNKDWERAIRRAFDAGVKGIINVGSNLATSKKAVEIAENYEKGIYAAVGLHPIEVDEDDFHEPAFLELAQNPKVVAVGETGLDYFHRSSREKQKEVFKKTVKIANSVKKPIILHNRESDDDLLALLDKKEYQVEASPRGVVHCFGRDLETAQKFFNLGFYLSFTGNITYNVGAKKEEMLKKVPLEKIMVETDCPYLAPQSRRGKRNEPAYIGEIARKLAEIKEVSFDEISRITTENAKNLFRIKESSVDAS